MKKIIESHAQPLIEWLEGKDRYVEHIGKAVFDDGEVVYWVGSCLGGESSDFRFENFETAVQFAHAACAVYGIHDVVMHDVNPF